MKYKINRRTEKTRIGLIDLACLTFVGTILGAAIGFLMAMQVINYYSSHGPRTQTYLEESP